MNVSFVLTGYFVIALIVFAVLDYFYVKKNNPEGESFTFWIPLLVLISMFWILLLVCLIFVMPFYVIDKLIKSKL